MPARTRTIRELQRELKAKRRLLTNLRAQRRKLNTKLTALDRRIAAVEGAAGPQGKPGRRRRRRRGPSLVTCIAKVLTGRKKGMRVKDIARAVQKAGYKTASKDFYRTVAAALRAGGFKRIRRGVYTAK